MALRDHSPVVLDSFQGLWKRGDPENVPLDHFEDCNNIRFIGSAAFATRYGIGISQNVVAPLQNVKRIYNYPTQTGNTLIILTYDGVTGKIYHFIDSATLYGPVLSIAGMSDFAFVPFAGRGYISPFTTYVVGGLNVEKGLQSQFLYVYAGDGTAARQAAGTGMSGTMTIANGAAGNTDAGLHIFGFVSETVSGYLSPPAILTTFTTASASSVSFGNIPTSGDPNVTKRLLVASKAITSYNGNLEGYQLFFVPNAVINDNTTIFLNNISFFDADLLDDASHLFDNYSSIPAGAVLTIYHNRLVLAATYTDISLALVSAIGEPEAINQISGLLIFPLDGNPITNAQELRDILYITKRSRTMAWIDDGISDPSEWQSIIIDNALGTSVHGIATVLDSGTSSVDFLIVCTYQGITLFNGRYIIPEMSWKIQDLWRALDRTKFGKIQIINAPTQKLILAILPDRSLLIGDYGNGFDPKNIRWSPNTFTMGVNTIAIYNIDTIILGADNIV